MILAGSAWAVIRRGFVMFPESGGKQISVNVPLEKGTSFAEATTIADEFMEIMYTVPGLTDAGGMLGGGVVSIRTYQDLLKKYEDEARKTDYGDFRGDGPEEDFHNGVDGVLRGSMYKGDRVKARYAPAEEYEDLYRRHPALGSAYRNIKQYLESGYVEPSTVTAKK